jgi:F0F1-type ATP synthase membrane subunit b/b'
MNNRLAIICALITVSVVVFGAMDLHAQEGETHQGEPATSESGQESGGHGSSAESSKHGKKGEGHGGDSEGWNTYWKPAMTQLIAFILLVAVYIQWVHPLLKQQHNERKERIQSDLQSIEEEKEKLRKREQEIEEKMASLEERAREEREEILERGRQLKEETIEEAEKHAEETIESAREEAKRIRERAVLEIQNTMTESALAALRSYFKEEAGQELHDQFQQGLIDSMKDVDSLDQFQRGDGDHMQEST